jgi:hypothetical protein
MKKISQKISHSKGDKYTVKNISDFPVKLFSATESLVSEIPAGDGKITNLFYSVRSQLTMWYKAYAINHAACIDHEGNPCDRRTIILKPDEK